MAQSSAGIKLYYGEGTIGSGGAITVPAAPTSSSSTGWTEIPDITSIPALQGEPNMLDTTVLAETQQKTYLKGLADNGGSLAYNAWFTDALITASTAAATAAASGKCRVFCLSFPAPISKNYWYKGECDPVLPGEAEVDAVLATTFTTSMETAPSTTFGS